MHLPVSAARLTEWTTVEVIEDKSICLAALLYEYVSVTAVLPRDDDRLFVSARIDKRHRGKFFGLGADRCAKVMGIAMRDAGVPADFLPHSARHAGQAYYKSTGLSDDDVMAIANMSARTYVLHYRRKIRRSAAPA